LDRVNQILIVIAVILCFLMAMVLRQPFSLPISSVHVENPLDGWLPGSSHQPVAIVPPGTNNATTSPSNSNGDANPNVTAANGAPTARPAPSYPIFPSLAPTSSPMPSPAQTTNPTSSPNPGPAPTPGPTVNPTPTPTVGPAPTPGPTVNPTPTPTVGATPNPAPTASFSFNPSKPTTGQTVSFDGTASRCAVGPCTYKWTDDGCSLPCGNLGSGPTVAFTFVNVGTKYVRLTVTDALAQTATVEHNVVVAAPVPPTASFSFNPVNPVIGQVVSFDGTASRCTVGPCTYKWTDDGCQLPCGDLGSGPTVTFTFVNVGTKYVRLTVTDALAQTATVEHNVVVSG